MNFVFVFRTERMKLHETLLHFFVQIQIRIIGNVLIPMEKKKEKRQRDTISDF